MDKRYYQSEPRFLTGIFLVGFICLMFELIQVRMFSFFLGSVSNFLAIPIALFGLSLGSLFCHYSFKGDKYKLLSLCSVLVFPVMLISVVSFFFVSNTYYNEIHAVYQVPGREVAKLFVYSGIFIPPYFLFGIMLAVYFTIGADRIGRLYFFDLAGAALGCLATPILFTYTNLRPVLIVALFVAAILAIVPRFPWKKFVLAGYGLVFVTITIFTYNGALLTEHPDAKILSRTLFKGMKHDKIEEVAVRWNELTRTSLIRGTQHKSRGKDVKRHLVIQDDGKSNVRLLGANEMRNRKSVMSHLFAHSLPYHLGLNPKKILVMFAGTGRDMILLDTLSNGKADITGVEINRSVVEFTKHPAVKYLDLKEFFGRKNIRMLVKEGRDFLNNYEGKFDFIFAATNGAVEANRIGHTRKYLDTYEAMSSYLRLLDDDGVMVFYNQPIERKILSFKKLLAEKGITDFKSTIEAYGFRNSHDLQILAVKPSGFTEDMHTLVKKNISRNRKLALYLSSFEKGRTDFETIAATPMEQIDSALVIDDKPFIREIDVKEFEFIPDNRKLRSGKYASDWIKIFTVLVFAGISLLVILAVCFVGEKKGRLPVLWLLYFFASGVAYMCVEIGLIAKAELFMGNPLYAIAAILALFLLSNSLGAMAQDRCKIMRGPLTMALFTTLSIIWGVVAVSVCNTYFLSLPIIVKILGVAIAVFPSGMCLGTFFPFGISILSKTKYSGTVPACYAIATLSSVLGSVFAMTAITNIGFSTIIGLGAVVYLGATVIFMAAKRFSMN